MDNKKLSLQYFLVFSFALILYSISLAPSLVWQDSGMIQYRVLHNDITGALGLALAHPLYYAISILFKNIPCADIIHRINFVTAIASAFAIGNLFLFVRIWLRRVLPALISAMTLAFTHTFWRHASIPETYNMYLAFFLAGLIFFLLYTRERKSLYLMLVGLFNGLAISVHMLAIIPLALYGVYILFGLFNKKISLKSFLLFVVAWIVGASLYEYLFVQELLRSGDFLATLRSALFGSNWSNAVLNTSMSLSIVKENIMYIGMNFVTINAVFGFVGVYSVIKNRREDSFGIFVLLLWAAFLLFAFRYTVPDRYAFFLPFYAVSAILIGRGVSYCIEQYDRKFVAAALIVFSLAPIFVYMALPVFVEKEYPIFKGKRHLPYRNEYRYFLQPWKTNYTGAKRFACEALDSVKSGSAIFADGTSLYPLAIAKDLYLSDKDVDIYSAHGSYDNLEGISSEDILGMLDKRDVYVVSPVKGYCLDVIFKNASFQKAGVLYKCIKK